jgi:hypothetical protein
MPVSAAKRDLPIVVVVGLMAASLGGLLLLSPIPQDQSYYQFADQRTIFGIPNFWNVVSNIPFLAVGAAGLRRFHDDAATVIFFLGVFLTGIGSSYYHWDPNDSTLFWGTARARLQSHPRHKHHGNGPSDRSNRNIGCCAETVSRCHERGIGGNSLQPRYRGSRRMVFTRPRPEADIVCRWP